MPQYRRPPRKKPQSNIGIVLISLLLSTVILFSLFNILGAFGLVIKNIILGLFGTSAYAFTIIAIIICIRMLVDKRITIDKSKAWRYVPLLLIGILAVHTMTTKSYIAVNYGDYLRQCYINGSSNAGGFTFGLFTYLLMSWAGYNFTLSLLVIAFFSVAFISIYPLFLSTGNIKTKKVKYPRLKKGEVSEVDEEIQVGNELFIGTPDGKGASNKIYRKSAFSSSKEREFDIMFPNKIDDDEETYNNPLIDKIKSKGTYDILINNEYDSIIEERPVKKQVNIDAPTSLIFPTVSNKEEATPINPVSKPKPIVSPSDKYANYTLGYRQAQIKKSLEDGVEIKSYNTSKRLGIFDDDIKEDKFVSPKRLEDLKSQEEKERFENAKQRLYGKDVEDNEPDRTFDSLFVNKKTPDYPKKTTMFEDKSKSASYNALYGNKDEIYKQSEFNLNDDEDREDLTTEKILKDLPNTVFNEIKNSNKIAIDEDDSTDEWTLEDNYNDNKSPVFGELPNDARKRALRSDIGKSHNVMPKRPNIMDVKVDAKQVSIVDSPTAVTTKTRYIAPPEELLKMYPRVESDSIDEHQDRCVALRNVLLEYGIDTVVDRYTVGPSFTRYEITMPIGVTVKKIQQISDDIAMRLKANKIRIEAPIPGKNAVGVEIANSRPSTVGMRDGIRSSAFKKESELSFLLGVNISGEVFTCNIAKMPHLLIAGATGAGKSVCINGLICSMLYKYTPDQVRFILVDPKRVELSMYNGLPHLLIPEIIYDAEKAINAMNWATKEMERRYELFHNRRVRNLDEHNKKAENEGMPTLPYIVIVIDELADLMTYKKRDIEEKIKRLAQLARAAGIHLIFATQRPSVDIITGTIKANFPSRIAFAVTSFADSKTILDHGGADKLRGQGDMLYSPSGMPDPIRLQGAFISNAEVEAITDFVRNNNKSYYDESIESEIYAVKAMKSDDNGDYNDSSSEDEFFAPALKLIIESDQASISMLQRRFAIGYARAARLIDEMEQRGYIGSADGSKPRDVKISIDDYHSMYNEDN